MSCNKAADVCCAFLMESVKWGADTLLHSAARVKRNRMGRIINFFSDLLSVQQQYQMINGRLQLPAGRECTAAYRITEHIIP